MFFKEFHFILATDNLAEGCYSPQRSCEGYVFTPVCLSTGGWSASVHAGIPSPPGARTPQSRHPPPKSRHSPRAGTSRPGTPPEQAPPQSWHPHPPADGYCCGWYTSYWNAFLLVSAFCLETKMNPGIRVAEPRPFISPPTHTLYGHVKEFFTGNLWDFFKSRRFPQKVL